MSGKWISVLLGNLVEGLGSHASRREPSFFRMKRTGAPWGEREGRMNPVVRFSSMNLRRAASSSWDKE